MSICTECKEDIKRNKCMIQCIICKSGFHTSCVKIKDEHVKLISQYENMGFVCKDCKSNSTSMEIKELKESLSLCIESIKEQHTMISKQSAIIEEHTKLLRKIEYADNTVSPRSYSEICKKNNEKILIRPLEKQESIQTINEVKENVNPSTLQIGVQSIKNIKDGGIIINCLDSNSKDKIKEKIENLRDKYNIEDVNLRNPSIIITNAEKEYVSLENKEIERCLKNQNKNLENAKMKVIRKYTNKYRSDSGNIIMELDRDSYEQAIKQGMVNFGWKVCNVYEHINVMQCFKCGKYGHKAEKCMQNESTCFKCAMMDHKTKDCKTEKFKCTNCTYAKEVLKINVDCEHAAYDKKCPCYIKNVERGRERLQI